MLMLVVVKVFRDCAINSCVDKTLDGKIIIF